MNQFPRIETFAEALEEYPYLDREIAFAEDTCRYNVGDVLLEDRSAMSDHRGHPTATLEILDIRLDLGIYWFWNETRQINTIGIIEHVDKSPFIVKT